MMLEQLDIHRQQKEEEAEEGEEKRIFTYTSSHIKINSKPNIIFIYIDT